MRRGLAESATRRPPSKRKRISGHVFPISLPVGTSRAARSGSRLYKEGARQRERESKNAGEMARKQENEEAGETETEEGFWRNTSGLFDSFHSRSIYLELHLCLWKERLSKGFAEKERTMPTRRKDKSKLRYPYKLRWPGGPVKHRTDNERPPRIDWSCH